VQAYEQRILVNPDMLDASPQQHCQRGSDGLG
jgi:hypothetical protein